MRSQSVSACSDLTADSASSAGESAELCLYQNQNQKILDICRFLYKGLIIQLKRLCSRSLSLSPVCCMVSNAMYVRCQRRLQKQVHREFSL